MSDGLPRLYIPSKTVYNEGNHKPLGGNVSMNIVLLESLGTARSCWTSTPKSSSSRATALPPMSGTPTPLSRSSAPGTPTS